MAARTFPSGEADDGAFVSDVRRIDAHTIDLSVYSPAMGESVPVRVLLPRSWLRDPYRSFPVLYLLQGAIDDYTSWTRETDVERLAAKSDVLVVMPDGGRAGFYTDWWNFGHPGGPRWETFHTVELPQILRGGNRVTEAQAVVGISEGGLGALDYAARHPGAYRFAGSFSGAVDVSDPLTQSAITLICLREGVDPRRLWGDPQGQRAIWNAHNPSRMIDEFRGTKVYLSAARGKPGRLDKNSPPLAGLLEAALYQQNAAFAERLRAAGVDVTAHLYRTGTHTWRYWRRELHRAWPSILAALGS
ncbi:esterase family protein [Streptomyces sp. RB6PN25]|uniref:Esterase family protein n=1 Tax=Streptomyces humicola TaxID=2953240 RepID=A0ABT1PPX5_9ACTN|nr:alpha/beta hydrolase family protein [Streptomyces humicola]MCQ4079719.1 esterase family protein [Streptomyces humicola]